MSDPRPETTVAEHTRALLQVGAAGPLADAELLERFDARAGGEAEAAFAALVDRHGPMVLRACRSILRDTHRAEDAFQATFLLLARRAGSLWVRDSIGPWLHSVACRVAGGSKAAEARRRAIEHRAAAQSPRSLADPGRDDLGSALHEEIERLPERLKAPVVLCYLEGLTHDRAAEHLACPVGTVRSRLARGRDRLRRGLARRGLAPTALEHDPHPSSVPTSLASLAIRSARLGADRSAIGPVARASILFWEGIKLMSIHPLKSSAALVLAAGALAAGLGATTTQDPSPVEGPPRAAEAPRARPSDEARFEAIERRLRDLELKLEEVSPPKRGNLSIGRVRHSNEPDETVKFLDGFSNALVERAAPVKIRTPFDNALVEKVFVRTGEVVKKGDPLVEIRCAELGQARNECRTAFVQWDHDHRFFVAREPLAKDGRITQLVWTETQNDEKKSRLDYLVSREKLATYGITKDQIDELLEGLGDDGKAGQPDQNAQETTRMTIVSPFDGVVSGGEAEAGNFFDRKNILLLITPSKP